MGRGASIKVGESATLRLHNRRVRATVVEDRGRLGPAGQRVLRIRIGDDAGEFELSEEIFDQMLDEEPVTSLTAAEYIRAPGSDTWHWCKNCSTYPRAIAETHDGGRPPGGELCNQCLSKERDGQCLG